MKKNNSQKIITYAMTGLLALLAVFWVFVAYKYFSGADNHTSLNISLMKFVAPFGFCLCVFLMYSALRRYAIAAGIFFALSLVGSYFIDQRSILLPYEVWIQRGMPAPGSPRG